MRRGGYRQQYIRPYFDAQVWCAGRWGPRRVRIGQCVAVVTAEDTYTELLRVDPSRVRPGAYGTVHVTVARRTHRVEWEIRTNPIWRFGRVFFTCPKCRHRATRVYLPAEHLSLACRQCWGLTYESRQNSYKRTGWAAILGPLGASETEHAHDRRRRTAAVRCAERRAILASARC
jgi:hypothetical protein